MRKIFILLFVVISSWIAYQLYQATTHRVEPIITTSADKAKAKSLPIKVTPAAVPVAPPPVVAPVAEAAPVEPTPPPEVNPLAPCPEKIYACFGALANNVLDPTCPVYKPVWAYFSKDDGANWVKVGCYATEIDAEKAIEKARKGVLLADKQAKEKASAALVTANTENKRSNKTAEEHKPKSDERKPNTENKTTIEATSVNVAEPVQEQNKPEAEKAAQAAKGYVAQFKGGLGFVIVASRTYQTEEMKKKALEMWDKDMRLLEPDGTVNEKYMIKKPTTTPLPGHY